MKFLNNKCTSFRLDSAPAPIIEAYQRKNGGLHLRSIQRECLLSIHKDFNTIFLCGVVGYLIFCLLQIFRGQYSTAHYQFIFGLVYVVSVFFLSWWLAHGRTSMSRNYLIMMKFIHEYEKLVELCSTEGPKGLPYPLADIATAADLNKFEDFIRTKLNVIAEHIVLHQEPSGLAKLGCEVSHLELKQDFKRIFDIMKPFGLVYLTYDLYFNPASMLRDQYYHS